MKNEMKTILICAAFFLLIGCSKESSPYSYSNESTIYSDNQTTTFKEFVVIVDPYVLLNSEKQFIVTDTIKNIVIKVNNMKWGVFNSFSVDTSIFEKAQSGKFICSNSQTKYSVIAPNNSTHDTLRLAGEYSDLLNNYFTLEPGNYILQIESFELKRSDGTVQKVKPFIVVPVEIKENIRSIFVGEFQVQVTNN